MASMNRQERALSYAKRLKEAFDIRAEARKILDEVDRLVWTESNNPLPIDEKIAIIKETRRIFSTGLLREKLGDEIIKASDNSGVIDVIDDIENELNRRNK